jgi:CRISPR-associated protein Csy2
MSCKYLLIPKINVINANALSSPFTIGFPAITAFLGFTHALQRKLNVKGHSGLSLCKTGVTSHGFEMQTYKGDSDSVNSIIIQKKSPYSKEDFAKFKQGKPPSFTEDPRCHMTVSIVIEVASDIANETAFLMDVNSQINNGMKLAGGDIISFEDACLFEPSEERKLIRHLMPGFSLIQRSDLMLDTNQELDPIDRLLGALAINHKPHKKGEDFSWRSERQQKGWIVPICTGFMGITDLAPAGQTKNQRDINVPHIFAESIVTLGEFVMPHTIKSICEMLFQYSYDKDKALYLCQQ